jgi:hypothetical protein
MRLERIDMGAKGTQGNHLTDRPGRARAMVG